MQETASRFLCLKADGWKKAAQAQQPDRRKGGPQPLYAGVKGAALAVTGFRSHKGAAAPAPRAFTLRYEGSGRRDR